MSKKTDMFTCAICGSEYDSVDGRALCETSCIQKKQQEEKRIAEEKYNKERNNKIEMLKNQIESEKKLSQEYYEKYMNHRHNISKLNSELSELLVSNKRRTYYLIDGLFPSFNL